MFCVFFPIWILESISLRPVLQKWKIQSERQICIPFDVFEPGEYLHNVPTWLMFAKHSGVWSTRNRQAWNRTGESAAMCWEGEDPRHASRPSQTGLVWVWVGFHLTLSVCVWRVVKGIRVKSVRFDKCVTPESSPPQSRSFKSRDLCVSQVSEAGSGLWPSLQQWGSGFTYDLGAGRGLLPRLFPLPLLQRLLLCRSGAHQRVLLTPKCISSDQAPRARERAAGGAGKPAGSGWGGAEWRPHWLPNGHIL